MFTLGANTWLVDYNDTTGGANFAADQTLSKFVTITAVPEPSTYLLVGIGVMGLAMMRKNELRKL